MKTKKATVILLATVMTVLILAASALAAPSPRAAKACNDGVDNDGDGYTDLADPGCSSNKDTSELNANIECDDGNDNDGDGLADWRDGGCSGPTDTDESNCGDGVCEGGETRCTCESDCGACNSCGDTDGGDVILTFGTTSGYLNGASYSHSDYCVDSSNIREHYCSGTAEQSRQQNCGTDGYVGDDYCSGGDVYRNYVDYSCASGACTSTTTPTLQQDCVTGQYCSAGQCLWSDSCSDTDGGNVITTFGTASGYLNNAPYSDDDYCVDSSNIMEYLCSGTSEQSSQQSCGTDGYTGNYCSSGDVYKDYMDYSCASGECDSTSTPTFQQDCDAGSGYVGSNYCYSGDVYKDWRDYYCSSGNCDSYNTTVILQQDCVTGQYCSAGQCLWSDSCSENDYGNNIWTFGTTNGYYDNNPYSHSDYCVDDSNVFEYYCSGTHEQSSQQSCGTDFSSGFYCISDDVYWTDYDYNCAGGKCNFNYTTVLVEDCIPPQVCGNSTGTCI